MNAALPVDGITPARALGWIAILRLGLVQAALGSIVVLVTSTLNRAMVIEYSLPATLPGLLVALHYVVQLVRPRFGYGSDRGGRQTPWIIAGMGVLAVGGVGAAVATTLLRTDFAPAIVMSVLAYSLVGLGVGAAGTSLLVLLAMRVGDQRRAAAATIMWVLMIAGFAVTSTAVGHFLDPFSPERLIRVVATAALLAFCIAAAAIFRVEPYVAKGSNVAQGRNAVRVAAAEAGVNRPQPAFLTALRRVWADPQARAFTLFVFVSMLAYSAQELLLEPFCGLLFGYSLGESAKLSGQWHGAVLVGMICVGVAGSGRQRFGSLRAWTIGGCCASALAIMALAFAGIVGPVWPLHATVVGLGLANGVFAVSAIGSMMELAHLGEPGTAGVRMGLWGAAQALAFAFGGLLGTGIVDGVRLASGSPITAFTSVFAVEAIFFLAAAAFAARVGSSERRPSGVSHTTAVIA